MMQILINSSFSQNSTASDFYTIFYSKRNNAVFKMSFVIGFINERKRNEKKS